MGKGGKVQQGTAAAADPTTFSNTKTPTKTNSNNNNLQPWQSPFTPERIDPRVSSMSLKEINAQFPTKSELRAVIPPHCFERSLPKSLFYVVRDIFFAYIVGYITYHTLSVDPPEGGLLGNPIGWILWRLGWNLYAFVMTASMGGLWVIGHECGHGAFSEYPVVNGTVGWILHSVMMVPYFSWAFSHAKHHRRTNDLIDGETHVPPTFKDVGLVKSESGDNYERLSKEEVDSKLSFSAEGFSYPLYGHALTHEHHGDEGFAWLMAWSRLFMGWQLYVAGVTSGGKLGNDGKPIERGTFPDHFRPHSRLFPAKMYWKVIASDIGILMTLSAIIYCSFKYSFRAVWFWYFGPYMLVHCFLVTVTWLQHTDPTVPHFDSENWNWMKGGLAGTIDRPLYGWVNFASHNIVTTHTVHHLFHEIPHYHAVEATAHVRAYLEPKGLYNFDPTPVMTALWRLCANCHFVDSLTDGVQYYRKFQDVPLTTETAAKDSKKSQ